MTTKCRFILSLLVAATIMLGAFSVIAQQDKSMAQIRMAHLAVDASVVDVYINGEAALIGIDFGDVSAWAAVPAGDYNITITPNGKAIDEAIIEPIAITFESEQWHTIAAIGLDGDSSLSVHVIQEDFSAIAPGETRLTVFHAIPNTGSISVLVNNTLLVAGLAYPTHTNDGLAVIDIVEGNYNLKIQLTEDSDVVIFELPDQLLTANRNYLIAAAGSTQRPELVFASTNPSTINSLLLAPEDNKVIEDAYIRVGHFSKDIPAMDIYIDGILSGITNIQYPALSEWVSVPTGAHSLAIAPTGTSIKDTILELVDINMDAGNRYTIAAIETISDPDIAPLMMQVIVEEYTEIPESAAHLTVLHADPSVAAVDIIINDNVLVNSLAYPGSINDRDGTTSFDISEGNYNVQITVSNQPENMLLEIANLEIQSGYYYFMTTINTGDNRSLFLDSRTPGN